MDDNYLIRLTHEGFPCWHILRVSRTKAPLLDKLPLSGVVDVTQIGQVLASGWGSNVPEEIAQRYGISLPCPQE